jgi:anti-sigma factor (TIGR02949 family)
LITCKQFLLELNEYLDDLIDPATKQEWQAHVDECPNCFVVVDTTKKTMRVYKDLQEQEVPSDVRSRVMQALERKMAARKATHSQIQT